MARRKCPSAPPWSEFREEFLGFYSVRPYPRATYFSVRRVLDVVEELGLKSLADLKPNLVTKFCARQTGKNGRPIKIRTVETQFIYFRLLCEYAAGQKYILADPTAARKSWIPDAGPEFTGRHLTAEQVRAIETQAEADAAGGDWLALRDLALFRLLSGLGLRRAEALGLPIRDVDLEDETLLIRRNDRRRCKTKKSEAYLPIPHSIVEFFRDVWFPQCGGIWVIPALDDGHMAKPWLHGSAKSRPLGRLKQLGLRAGVKGVNFLVFRHSWATEAELRGASGEDIQKVLRHTTPLTAKEFYRHAGAVAMRPTVDLVTYAPAEQPPTLRIVGARN